MVVMLVIWVIFVITMASEKAAIGRGDGLSAVENGE